MSSFKKNEEAYYIADYRNIKLLIEDLNEKNCIVSYILDDKKKYYKILNLSMLSKEKNKIDDFKKGDIVKYIFNHRKIKLGVILKTTRSYAYLLLENKKEIKVHKKNILLCNTNHFDDDQSTKKVNK